MKIGMCELRQIKYLSPTSILLWKKDRTQFFQQYLNPLQPLREPQTEAMAAGSAFDAKIKSHLYPLLNKDDNPNFAFNKIFLTQVEEQNQIFGLEAAEYLFDAYNRCGAVADLLLDLSPAMEPPRMEFVAQGEVCFMDDKVTLYGKPDLFYRTNQAAVIADWKVNGYCSKSNVSPKKGYIKCRENGEIKIHKDLVLDQVFGIPINTYFTMEEVDRDWATQLSIYAWLLGAEVGSPIIGRIEQLACQGAKRDVNGLPPVRVATHSCLVSAGFQIELFKDIVKIWRACTDTGYIFDDIPPEDNYTRICTMVGNTQKEEKAKSVDDFLDLATGAV